MNDWIKGSILGSLRKRTAQEVRKHRKRNAAVLQNRSPLATKILHVFFRERGILKFVVFYFAFVFFVILLEIGVNFVFFVIWLEIGINLEFFYLALRGAEDPHVGLFLKDLTSYFLAAQVVMIGLLFPIAVGLVTLIVQREDASSTVADVQVYYGESLAYGVGASGIALSIVLAIQLTWPVHLVIDLLGFPNPGESSKILLTAVHLLWLVLNFTALWHFLAISLSFVRPNERARLRRRFTVRVAIPNDLSDRLLQALYVNADALVLPRFGDRTDDDTPSLLFGTTLDKSAKVEIACHKLSNKFLCDVYIIPLGWAVRCWLKRCEKQSFSNGQGVFAPTLAFTAYIGAALPEGGLLCARENGVPLSGLERLVIKWCFRLKKKSQEIKVRKDRAEPSDMLEELADKVIGHMDRLAVTSFKTALDEMLNFHRFLIDAYATTGEIGRVASYAQVGGWSAPHEKWIKQYRRLFMRATDFITKEDEFIYILLRIPHRLLPADSLTAAPAVTAGLLDLGNIFVHQLEAWLTRRRVFETAHNEKQPATRRLAGSDKQAYEDVIRRFVGEWESVVRRTQSMYGWSEREINPDEEWYRYRESWPLLERHLRNSAYMLAVAVWNEDEIGANHYSDMLLCWFNAFRHQLKDDYHLFERLLTPNWLDKEWQDVQGTVAHPEWQ